MSPRKGQVAVYDLRLRRQRAFENSTSSYYALRRARLEAGGNAQAAVYRGGRSGHAARRTSWRERQMCLAFLEGQQHKRELKWRKVFFLPSSHTHVSFLENF